MSVTWGYNNLLQRESLSLAGATGSYGVGYTYETGGRLHTISEGNSLVTYTYLANSPLVGQITFAQSGTTRMVTTKQYDRLNRLQSVASVASGPGAPPLLVSDAYLYNAANQRTRATLADGSYWLYSYDRLGQVISGKRFWQDGTPVAGQQYEYAFDDIGNRRSTGVGGDASGGGLRNASYTANRLNQYCQRDVPGVLDILGIANPTAAVTANGSTAYRKGDYFDYALPVANSAAPQYASASVTSSYPPGQTSSGSVFVPKTPELFAYDADGNLTNDGRWTYTWDAENRLVALTNISTVPAAAKMALVFGYDWQGRRISKTVYTNNAGIYILSYCSRFVYDGWNLIAALPSDLRPLTSFLWGLDLSGSLQGAGGVGGLLRVSSGTTNCFAAFDGNGNVTALINAADASAMAQYEYGPFGEVIRATGPMARANPFRFSTKYQDDETDLLYYGYRYYDADTGRWINRDPAQEYAGVSVVAFLQNSPLGNWDYLGLCLDGDCGPEASYAVGRTLSQIQNTYSTWNIAKKFNACSHLVLPVWAADSWDMNPLAELGMAGEFNFMPPARQGTGACGRTVTYKKKCYHAGAVNFMTYGKMNCLCDQTFGWAYYPLSPWSLSQTTARVAAWKVTSYRGAQLFETLDFTIAGYRGTDPSLSGVREQCFIDDGNFLRENTLEWRWVPYHY